MISAVNVPAPSLSAALVQRSPKWAVRPADDRFLPTGRPVRLPRRAGTKVAVERAEAPKKVSIKEARRALVELNDLGLLTRVIAGDELAFEVFHQRFRGLMVACISRVAVRSGVRLKAEDLNDVLAEVSLNLVAHDYRRLRLYRTDGGCSVSSWIGVIASSTAHDHLRKARRHRLDPMLDAELERVAPSVEGPDSEMIDREQRSFVDQALSGFSSRDRRFVELYFLDAMDPEAIAVQMGVSVSTVYSKKAKIKTRLRSLARAAA